jgi:tetratricopeptide (TPR) repeat protein
VTLPGAWFLRATDGNRVGPLALQWLEILFDARMIDERTPVSDRGRTFRPVEDWPALARHLASTKERVAGGHERWDVFAPAPELEGPSTSDLKTLAEDETALLSRLLRLAVLRTDCVLSVRTSRGPIELHFRDGKVIAIDASRSELNLQAYLLRTKMVSSAAMAEAASKAGVYGGDLGAALVATGVIPGEAYFETFEQWALWVLSSSLEDRNADAEFEPRTPPAPAVPLSFDRYDVYIEAVRTLPKPALEAALARTRGRALILSQVEDVSLDDFKLKPKELRTLNSVNGARSLDDLLETLGPNEEMRLAVLRIVFFATEAGFLVFGHDPLEQQELLEAERLQRELSELEGKDFFAVLGVARDADPDTIRSRYTELARRTHPDGLRLEAAEPLRVAREQLFAKYGEAMDTLGTASKRERYLDALDEGNVDYLAEEQRVQAAAQAETAFRKAGVLVRVRKFDEALALIDKAIELAPEPDYRIAGIHTRYLAALGPDPAVGAQEAVERITPIVSERPTQYGNLILAQLYKALGQFDTSTRHYLRVLKEDPKHPEAQQEVRLASIRRERKKAKRGWLG